MYNKYTIKEEFNLIDTFKMLAQAYEEISVIKMQRVRSSVLSTRDFLDDLSQVFGDVKSSYQQELLDIVSHKKKKKSLNPLQLFSRKKGTVGVFISSSTKLYGDIVARIFHLFIEDIKKGDFDIVIVGKHGKEMFDQAGLGKKYTFFDLPDANITIDHLKPIYEFLMNYERVNVYYGLFNNVVLQTPTVSTISGQQTMSTTGENTGKKINYIFEPSLDEIFYFFQNQVLIALFKQTVHETELSRLASRITAMEQALGNIEKSEESLVSESRKITKLLANKKQIDAFSGISLWQSK